MEAKSKLKWLVAAMQQHPHHGARLMQWATIPGMAGIDCPHQSVCRMAECRLGSIWVAV